MAASTPACFCGVGCWAVVFVISASSRFRLYTFIHKLLTYLIPSSICVLPICEFSYRKYSLTKSFKDNSISKFLLRSYSFLSVFRYAYCYYFFDFGLCFPHIYSIFVIYKCVCMDAYVRMFTYAVIFPDSYIFHDIFGQTVNSLFCFLKY